MLNTPVIRYHGSKFRIADWVIKFFPQHRCYVEPFGGGGSVLMQKPNSYAEVYNDLDNDIYNLFRVLRDEDKNSELVEKLNLTPYSRTEFDLSYIDATDDVEQARRTIVRATMGFGSGGATKGKTGFRIDTKREYTTAMQLFSKYPDNLRQVLIRLRDVLIENRDAIECMKDHDSSDTLHYVDPPYVKETRARGAKVYKHEMTDDEHRQLIRTIRDLKGYVLISGYDNPIYREGLHDWEFVKKDTRASGGRGTVKRTEYLWMNPRTSTAQSQIKMAL